MPQGLSLVLDDLGPTPERSHPSWPWLTIEEYFSLWEDVALRAGDRLFGARLGIRAADQVLFEPVFLVCLGSRSLGEALERLARYKETLCPERVELRRRGEEVEIRYSWPMAPRPPPPILVEAELAFLLALARNATRHPPGQVRVQLTRPPEDPAPWTTVLEAEVRFGARIGYLRFPASLLDVAFLTHNPPLVRALEPALEAERSRCAAANSDIVARVRQHLELKIASGEVSLAEIAGDLAMSVRTLQRRLNEVGTTFAAELRATRQERATYLLQQSNLSVSEVAYLVGFDSAPSFFRAFAEWTGRTPASYRRGTIR